MTPVRHPGSPTHRAPTRATPYSTVSSRSPRIAAWSSQPSPWRISSAAGLAGCWVRLSAHPCLPCCQRNCRAAGPHRSGGITHLPRYRGPLRHPLAFRPLPRCTGYRAYLAPPLSRRDEEGFSSCLTRPGHRAVALTPPEWLAASVRLRRSMLPSPYGSGLGLWGFRLSRPPCVHVRYGPMTRFPS